MKKLFLFAAAALALTACTSENDILETGPTKQATSQAVGFDVYTPAATTVTRTGFNEGTMNTTRLQFPTVGFGVFGYYSDQSTDVANPYPKSGYVPNFMYNEHVTWNNTNKGWVYSPLKYWPNETIQDSQANPEAAIMDGTNDLLDQLTFFAYAPYVNPSSSLGTEGITAITANDNGKLTTTDVTPRTLEATDALVEYTQSALVKNGVDLLWGVAPAGGLHYTAVNGETSGANQGLPYVNLTKPDVNTSLKLYFQHALARFGFTVAAAIDQLPQGGELATETSVTVESVELSGYFGTKGILNLNNSVENAAKWVDINGTPLTDASTLDAVPLVVRSVTISGTNLNPKIKDNGDPATAQTTTVTTAKQDLLDARYSKVEKPASFSTAKAYYTSAGVEKHATMENTGYYLTNVAGDFVKVGGATINSPAYGTPIPNYYTITPGDAVTSWTSGDLYHKEGDNYAKVANPSGVTDFTSNDYFQFTATPAAITPASFTYPDGDYYLPERSYLMVIPTNNVSNIATGLSADDIEALKTVWVKITYYVTTEDGKLDAKRSRIKNVIKKKVVLPSLENGKSYNLNLLLGLTSVKVEAEVGDWKEVYIQTDLPQNTPGE